MEFDKDRYNIKIQKQRVKELLNDINNYNANTNNMFIYECLYHACSREITILESMQKKYRGKKRVKFF